MVFHLVLNRKENPSPRSYSIQFAWKWKSIFRSVIAMSWRIFAVKQFIAFSLIQPGKTTAIRRAAVRETGVFRHHAFLGTFLEHLEHHSTMILRAFFKGGPSWVSFSDNKCDIIPGRTLIAFSSEMKGAFCHSILWMFVSVRSRFNCEWWYRIYRSRAFNVI